MITLELLIIFAIHNYRICRPPSKMVFLEDANKALRDELGNCVRCADHVPRARSRMTHEDDGIIWKLFCPI
jgi:hypothetical protein